MIFIHFRLNKWLLAVLVAAFGLAPAAHAALNCAPNAVHELNKQDQKLCVAGVGKLDALLNDRYKVAMERLDSEERKALLRKEQRTWLQARNRCESTACFVEAYEQRIQQLENFMGQEQGSASAPSAIALSDIRQVVEGAMVGFVRAKEGQMVPTLFVAPDGTPDMVFLPKIKGQQDVRPLLDGGKILTFESFFGRRRFEATLLTKKIEGNIRVLGLRMPDKTEWTLVGLHFNNSAKSDREDQVSISDSPMIGPRLETFNVYCDAPGGAGIVFDWRKKRVRLDRQIVVLTSEPDYPCQGPQEVPTTESYKRRFRGDFGSTNAVTDERTGAFVQAEHYIIHIDSRKSYAPVEMLTPEVMLLDSALMKPFRERVKAEFDKHNSEVNNCRGVILNRRPPNRKLTVEEVSVQNKELANCNTWLGSPEFSEAQFIQAFVPEQWKNLWAN